ITMEMFCSLYLNLLALSLVSFSWCSSLALVVLFLLLLFPSHLPSGSPSSCDTLQNHTFVHSLPSQEDDVLRVSRRRDVIKS
ncbi:hypothetical protein BJ875DRAFT_476353, partial [Amylocarpus encephaloides]